MEVVNQNNERKPFVETPAHTIEDEEDFSGVVEGPLLKVREIRDKYKVRDYENYAKPKSSSNNTSRKGSDDGSRQSLEDVDQLSEETKSSNNEVAQQVMNLFKGALDVEKELTVFEEETLRSQKEQNNQLSPAKRNGHVTTVIETTYKEAPARETRPFVNPTPGKLDTAAWPPVQPERNEEEEKTEGKVSAEQAKTETKEVESFDDSLDQFYDVLNDLTS